MTRLRHRLAEAEGAADAEVKAVVGAAAADAEQIVATFDALLRIAQIEAGARRERFADVNLSEVLETIADAYAPDAEQSGQRLKATVAAGLHVTGDRELLTQAFPDRTRLAVLFDALSGQASAAEQTAKALSRPSPNTSPKNTPSRATAVVIPLKS